MSYTYLATSVKDGEPLAAFPRLHELERWCTLEANAGYPLGGWLSLYRIRSAPWSRPSRVVELEYVHEDRGIREKRT